MAIHPNPAGNGFSVCGLNGCATFSCSRAMNAAELRSALYFDARFTFLQTRILTTFVVKELYFRIIFLMLPRPLTGPGVTT
jgi:hypothetical protein